MNQSLQGAFRFRIEIIGELGRFRNDAGEEMMLIGESGYGQTPRLRSFREAGPIKVRGHIGMTHRVKW